jgi:hypothetical protein
MLLHPMFADKNQVVARVIALGLTTLMMRMLAADLSPLKILKLIERVIRF